MTSALSQPADAGDAGDQAGVDTTSSDDWRAALALTGEFDVANAERLRSVLDSHLDAGRRVLRIDLSGVAFMDSTAIGALVHAHDRCTRDHGSVILTGVSHRLARLFEITGLDHVLLVDSATPDPAAPASG